MGVFRQVKEIDASGKTRWVRKSGSGPGTWFIEYYSDGKQRREATDAQSKGKAQQLLKSKLSANVDAEILGIPARAIGMTFGRFVQDIFLPHAKLTRRPGTYELYCDYAQTVERALGGLELRKITRGHVQQFISERLKNGITRQKRTIAPATVNREVAFVRTVFYDALGRDLVDRNPCARIEMQNERNVRSRVLSVAEEKSLLEKSPAWLVPIIKVAVLAGLRRGEILALKWVETATQQDHFVDLERGMIHVSAEAKDAESRVVPITADLRAILAALPRNIREGKQLPWLFVDAVTSEPYTPGTIADQFNRAVRRANVTNLHFHDLRRTFASRLAEQDVSLQKVAKLLGHGATYVTERYAHLSDAAGLEDAVALLSRAAKPRARVARSKTS